MNGSTVNAYGKASWPTDLGSSALSHVSPVIARSRAQTLWTVPITAQQIESVVVAEDGCLFLVADDILCAIEADGRTRWRREESGLLGSLVVLANGGLLITEGGGRHLVMRDQRSGAELWHLEGRWAMRGPDVLPNGDILIQDWSDQADNEVYLNCISSSGKPRWRYKLSALSASALILPNLIVAVDGPSLVGLNLEGKRLWLANRHGFSVAGELQLSEKMEHECINTPPMHAGGSEIVIGWSSWDGHDLLIFDTVGKTVKPMQNTSGRAMIFSHPIAVPLAPERRVAGGWGGELVVFDFSGALVFERQLPLPIVGVIGDAVGNIIVSTSTDRKYWQDYRDAYNLHEACALTCFDGTGDIRFKWIAPGPISSHPVLGKSGELYCVSESKLFAIG